MLVAKFLFIYFFTNLIMQNIFSCVEAIFTIQKRKYLIYSGNLKTELPVI